MSNMTAERKTKVRYGRSSSFKVIETDTSPYATSCWSSFVAIFLSSIISEI